MQQIVAPDESQPYKRSTGAPRMNHFHPYSWALNSEAKTKLLWILKLRWVALVLQLLSTVPGRVFGFLPADKTVLFLAVIGAMGIFNTISTFTMKNAKVRQGHLLAQLTVDLLGLSALLFITGGLRNPLIALLLFHAAFGPMLLETKWNKLYFAFLVAAVLALSAAPPPEAALAAPIHASILLVSQMIVALAIWQLTTWLSRTLFIFRNQVRQFEQHENRMDRLRAVGALAAGFSHEFATPLNTVKVRLDRLERKLDRGYDSMTMDDVLNARAAVDQCELALRNLHRAQVDESHLNMQALPLDIFTKRICDSWVASHKNAKLDLRLGFGDSFQCRIPQLLLSQTLINILDNAWEAAPECEVKVELSLEDRWIVLKIRDHGPGLPELVLEKIGEPFITTKPNGTGLGLYNAVNLLTAMGGRFHVSNRSDGGAEAGLYFPREEKNA